MPLVATCARGCERALKFEYKELGVERSVVGKGALLFDASLRDVPALNIFSRIASRVLWVVARFRAETPEVLVGELAAHRFERYFRNGTTFAIEAHLRAVPWTHTLYAAQRVKDVIVDRFRARRLPRPEVDPQRPNLRFVLHWDAGDVTLSLDTTGEPLHRRGYRPRDAGDAPMRENLAAAMLAIGHADLSRPFIDPVCGSGTLGVEQGLRALRRFPAARRRFAFERWHFIPVEVERALRAARERARDEERPRPDAPIRISDIDPAQVARAAFALERMGLSSHVELRRADATQARFDGERPVVVGNLPFGERMGGEDERALAALYRALGRQLENAVGLRALLLSSHPDTERLIGLGAAKTWPLYSGALPSVLHRWDPGYVPPAPRPSGPRGPT